MEFQNVSCKTHDTLLKSFYKCSNTFVSHHTYVCRHDSTTTKVERPAEGRRMSS